MSKALEIANQVGLDTATNGDQIERFAELLKAAHLEELAGVEMPEPVGYVDDYYSSCYYTANTPTNRYKTLKPTYTLNQCQQALAAAVARTKLECSK